MSLAVVRALGLVTVQDLGTRGRMHEAIPPGGALVPELLVAANRHARNPDGALAIEIMGQLVVGATTDVLVGTTAPHHLRAGEELTIASTLRCAYLALRGGVAAARATLLCAELGRPLRGGDSINAAAAPEQHAPVEAFAPSTTIRVIPGPDSEAFVALDALFAGPYRVLPSSDRVGTRLAGNPLALAPSFRARSRPMVLGALEVPADGQPIVLGPEHPTTGGYPIAAVIAAEDMGRFFAIPLGGSVNFISASR